MLTLSLSCLAIVAAVASGAPCEKEDHKDELAELRSNLEALKSVVASLTDRVSNASETVAGQASQGGVTYTRWGRLQCNDTGAQLLYRGHAAGPRYTDRGGGSNFLCLPEWPQWKNRSTGSGSRGLLFGVEYEFHSHNNVFSETNNGGYPLAEHPAPCAVCYVSSRETSVMIPARVDCPAGWTREYGGYLVSEATYSSRPGRSSYICWDEAPETASGDTAQNQAIIYPVHAGCGSLPCSRYRNNWALTCVVCTN